ncbi:hypothetical protein TRFO_26778 [Tritrichomonas foetus]|uniref:UBA domain-containing protein n=1 Tax=Tritrichomonas foetus TaxID=1144522 RepID=A0A1J4K284_9EUKA|nr:hypothetical protein TRFO_26778 [Tritrichomonas foetus]|eukprot:OHT05503.1 hypothetical protein TRFO_26778 [Tritrichomonas foetus]
MISTSFDSDNEEEDDEDDDLYNELESINDFMMNFDNENDIDEEEDSEEEDSEEGDSEEEDSEEEDSENNSEEDEEEDFANSDEENEDDEAIALSLFPGIEFAQNDRDSINRIVHFGYDRATVIQVYIACGRNEENTIECLMSMMQ